MNHFSCFVILTLATLACYAQEYLYDDSGNILKDSNKKIKSIHYNHLNLTDTIVFEDGRKMIYTYSSSGRKLMMQAINADGTISRKSDYVAGFLYSDNKLHQVKTEAGRTVPFVPGSSNTLWEYQYEQKDQTGDVRNLLTSRQQIDTDLGTFETSNVSVEQNGFQRYENVRRINSTLFDHTNNGTTYFAERLNGSTNEKYGLAKSISVMPGDVVNMEVFAKYVDPDVNHWTAALNTLITQIAAGTAPAGTVIDGSGYSTGTTSFPFAGLSGSSGSTGAGPKAYINWLLFDNNYVFQDGGYVRMSTVAKENGTGVVHERLSKQLNIQRPGLVYVYLSNEELTPVDVYFDDFKVDLVKGPFVQQTNYDPFGLTFNEAERENAVPNNFLYNGKELQKNFGLDWYDYGARMYDAALGRWHEQDPMSEKLYEWSPYNYVANNPIKFIDPDGRYLVIWYEDGNGGRASYHYSGGRLADLHDLPDNDYVRQAVIAVNYLVDHGAGEILQEFARSKNVNLNIEQISSKDGDVPAIPYDGLPVNNTIQWDPRGGIVVGLSEGRQGIAGERTDVSPAVNLETLAAIAKYTLNAKKNGETDPSVYSPKASGVFRHERNTAAKVGEIVKGKNDNKRALTTRRRKWVVGGPTSRDIVPVKWKGQKPPPW